MILMTSALDLWKDAVKFCYLYSNPECYLSGASDDALEEVPLNFLNCCNFSMTKSNCFYEELGKPVAFKR